MTRGPAFGSVRSRLALLLASMLTLLFGIFSVMVYERVESWTVQDLDRSLDREMLHVAERAVRGVPAAEILAGPDAPARAAIVSPEGAIATTPEWHAAGLGQALREIETDRAWWDAPDGTAWRVRRAGLSTGAGVAVARDGTAQRLMLERLYVVLGLGLSVMIVTGGAAAWIFAADATRPLRSLAEQASAITADRLSTQRLHPENPHDEFGVLADAFNHTLERLDESFSQLRRFTSDASHQLRTPLTALRATGEAALSGPNDAAHMQAAVETMLEQSARLGRLVNELLTLARGESGQTPMRIRAVDVGALARETVESIGILAEEKGQTVELAVDGAPGVLADAGLLRHALLNIVDNAIRYSPEGGRIRVAVFSGDDGVAIAVDDTGPGIPEAERELVFERFYRSQDASRDAPDGTGLGLPIARWCVETCGGSLTAGEAPGGGARMRIVLPFARR